MDNFNGTEKVNYNGYAGPLTLYQISNDIISAITLVLSFVCLWVISRKTSKLIKTYKIMLISSIIIQQIACLFNIFLKQIPLVPSNINSVRTFFPVSYVISIVFCSHLKSLIIIIHVDLLLLMFTERHYSIKTQNKVQSKMQKFIYFAVALSNLIMIIVMSMMHFSDAVYQESKMANEETLTQIFATKIEHSEAEIFDVSGFLLSKSEIKAALSLPFMIYVFPYMLLRVCGYCIFTYQLVKNLRRYQSTNSRFNQTHNLNAITVLKIQLTNTMIFTAIPQLLSSLIVMFKLPYFVIYLVIQTLANLYFFFDLVFIMLYVPQYRKALKENFSSIFKLRFTTVQGNVNFSSK